jgi:tetratricopeptide (TPR) repeat protein
VAVIAFVLIVLAAFKVYRESQNDWKVKYDELLKISEATGAALNKFRIRIEGARATADTAGRLMDNPELRRLGAELAQATDEFDARYRSQQTPEMALQIRLARARAAIAEGRFADAQELVSDADLAAQTMTTVNMLLVRADASFGLGHWDSAKEYYERVLSINPTHIGAFLVRAIAHSRFENTTKQPLSGTD